MVRFAIAPIRELMGNAGADLVAKDAVVTLIEHLESEVKRITKLAVSVSKNDGRTKIMADDIKSALG